MAGFRLDGMRADGWPYRRDLVQDGLAREHQADEGTARWNGDLAHHINNPEANGICRVYGPWRAEDLRDFFLAHPRPLDVHGTDAPLLGEDVVKALA